MADNYQTSSQIIARKWDRFARLYNFMSSKSLDKYRKRIWSIAYGRVLEVGVGTGFNFPFYSSFESITGIDLSSKMLSIAENRRNRMGLSVDLMKMDIQDMTFEDETFDTVVSTCVFCTVPDPVRGLCEVRRVCKKGGQILLLEHVRSSKPAIGWIMDLLNPVITAGTGTHINRNTVENVKKANINIVNIEPLISDILLLIRGEPK